MDEQLIARIKDLLSETPVSTGWLAGQVRRRPFYVRSALLELKRRGIAEMDDTHPQVAFAPEAFTTWTKVAS